MSMSAYDHATLCVDNAENLYFEYGKISPIFRCGVLSRKYKDYAGLVYCHPNDVDKEYVEDFEHGYCDL